MLNVYSNPLWVKLHYLPRFLFVIAKKDTSDNHTNPAGNVECGFTGPEVDSGFIFFSFSYFSKCYFEHPIHIDAPNPFSCQQFGDKL